MSRNTLLLFALAKRAGVRSFRGHLFFFHFMVEEEPCAGKSNSDGEQNKIPKHIFVVGSALDRILRIAVDGDLRIVEKHRSCYLAFVVFAIDLVFKFGVVGCLGTTALA